MASSIRRSRDVLFLGRSGEGKTTTINTLANICAYWEFKTASTRDEPLVLVPFQYEINYNDKSKELIKMGGMHMADAGNEQILNPELSCTQSPRIYSFIKDDKAFNFIDMPGFGDTSGAGQDEEHKIQRHEFLRSLKELHAIIVVLNSTQNRLTPSFKAALNDVLALVPKAAISNLLFLGTRALDTNFTGAMIERPLQEYLDEVNKNYEVKNNQKLHLSVKKNFYYVDYVAFRHLVNKHRSARYRKETEDVGDARFAMCWNKTRDSLFNVMTRVIGLHGVETSLIGDIDDARSKVEAIIHVMFKITMECEELKTPRKQEELRRNYEQNGNLQSPCTFCKSCKAPTKNGNVFHATSRVCHRDCRCYGSVPALVCGHQGLQKCSIFVNGKCKVCGCRANCHYFDYDITDVDAGFRKMFDHFQKTIDDEMRKISQMVILAVSFLRENTIVAFSKGHQTRLQEEINRFENNGDLDLADERREVLANYEKTVGEIEHLMEIAPQRTVRAKEVQDAFKKLFNLQVTGKDIEKEYNDRTRHNFNFEEPCIYKATHFPDWREDF